MEYYSQVGQDRYLNEKIFKGKEPGYFVDIGANNGITFSNSYFFEKRLNWKGICIEPLPEIYQQLKINRQCICIEGAIAQEQGEREFLCLQGPDMLSGLVDEFDPRHVERIYGELQACGGSYEVIHVKTYPLQFLLELHGVTHIDLCSVDTEGSEFSVLKSIDFSKVKIECIVVENNYQTTTIEEYLLELGYQLVQKLGMDDVFLHSESCFLGHQKV